MASRAYHRKYSREYYHERKAIAVELLGGKCVHCSTALNLGFDHIDPLTKLFPIGKLLNFRWAIVLAELKKCQLLCTSCHDVKSSANGDFRTRRKSGRVGLLQRS